MHQFSDGSQHDYCSGCEIASELTTYSLQLGRPQMMDLALVEAQSFMHLLKKKLPQAELLEHRGKKMVSNLQ